MPTKKFDPDDFEAFLKLLPKSVEGRDVRHAVEVRHDSFKVPDFVELAREHGVAIVIADKDGAPLIADITAPFVYVRLQRSSETAKAGYAPKDLDAWAKRAQGWAKGGAPDDLKLVAAAPKSKATPRGCLST